MSDKIKPRDKVYLKHNGIVVPVIEVIEEELEHPHNGDTFKFITKITATINNTLCYLPIDCIMTKEEITYKIKSLEKELINLKNASMEMI